MKKELPLGQHYKMMELRVKHKFVSKLWHRRIYSQAEHKTKRMPKKTRKSKLTKRKSRPKALNCGVEEVKTTEELM